MSPEEENQNLKKKLRELEESFEKEKEAHDKTKKEFDKTKKGYEKIEKDYEKIEKEYEKTKKDFEEFKAKHAVTVSHLQHALNIRPDKKEKGKPVGLPKGHKSYCRHIPERIDYVKTLIPEKCPHCGTKLGATQEIRQRYLTDVKLRLEAVNTRYNIHRRYCRNCKKLVEQPVPNALPRARLGLNLMLLIMYLRLGLLLPGNKVCDLLSTVYNIHISEGGIVVVLRQLVKAFGPHYTQLEKVLKLARVKHTDSTGWRVNGKNYFAWVFISAGVVMYKIRKRNNHKVGLSLFGQGQKGNVLIVDRHSAFRTLAEKAGFLLQLCWAHILRNSKDLAKSFGAEGHYVHRKLKEIFALAKGLNHKGTPEQVQQLQGMVFELTQRHYLHSTVRKFVNSLYYRDIDNLFRFVTDPDINPTNNVSEQKLRTMVLMRKISNGSRSRRGAAATAMLLSVLQTLRTNKENILLGLQKILQNTSG